MKKIELNESSYLEILPRKRIILKDCQELIGKLLDVRYSNHELRFYISIYNRMVYELLFEENDSNAVLEHNNGFIIGERIGIIRIDNIVRTRQKFKEYN